MIDQSGYVPILSYFPVATKESETIKNSSILLALILIS